MVLTYSQPPPAKGKVEKFLSFLNQLKNAFLLYKKSEREIENGKCKRDISCQIFDWKQYTIVHTKVRQLSFKEC